MSQFLKACSALKVVLTFEGQTLDLLLANDGRIVAPDAVPLAAVAALGDAVAGGAPTGTFETDRITYAYEILRPTV